MTSKDKPSFDDIIQQGRLKKKNEKLAEKIFRRGSTPQTQPRPRNQSPSLASRVGVQKRPQNPRQPTFQASSIRGTQNARHPKVTPRNSAPANSSGTGITIKGMGSGSCIVIAQNFAPGTTAGDIEAVMAPLGDQGVTSCRLIASHPTVIAELVFSSRDTALKIVEQFNNKMADGHRLYVYIKQGTNTPQVSTPANPPRAPRAQELRQPILHAAAPVYDDDVAMEAGDTRDDEAYRNQSPYQKAPPTQPRRAEPSFEDGRYGFGNGSTTGYYEDRGYDDSDRSTGRYDDRTQSNRGYGNRGGQNTRYRQDKGSRGGQGRLASDSILGRR